MLAYKPVNATDTLASMMLRNARYRSPCINTADTDNQCDRIPASMLVANIDFTLFPRAKFRRNLIWWNERYDKFLIWLDEILIMRSIDFQIVRTRSSESDQLAVDNRQCRQLSKSRLWLGVRMCWKYQNQQGCSTRITTLSSLKWQKCTSISFDALDSERHLRTIVLSSK